MASVANAFSLLTDDAVDVDISAEAAAAPVKKVEAPKPAADEPKGEFSASKTHSGQHGQQTAADGACRADATPSRCHPIRQPACLPPLPGLPCIVRARRSRRRQPCVPPMVPHRLTPPLPCSISPRLCWRARRPRRGCGWPGRRPGWPGCGPGPPPRIPRRGRPRFRRRHRTNRWVPGCWIAPLQPLQSTTRACMAACGATSCCLWHQGCHGLPSTAPLHACMQCAGAASAALPAAVAVAAAAVGPAPASASTTARTALAAGESAGAEPRRGSLGSAAVGGCKLRHGGAASCWHPVAAQDLGWMQACLQVVPLRACWPYATAADWQVLARWAVLQP